MFKKLLQVGAMLTIAAGLLVAPATAANAGAYGCTGTDVGSWPVYDEYGTVGDIHLYYDSSTGWNCAAAVKRTSYVFYGLATHIYITINNSAYDDNHVKNNFASDSGMYKYYAGPAKVYGKGMCIWLQAGIADVSGPNAQGNYITRYVNRVACG
ncbi:hypothetical protein Psi02_50010 [Planotetraspora silvatica]|uniref:Spore-associated protein A n=1 Tax=Planotetraspora silvatica TaxID=234614 RepID=A0A8J3XNI1_9ACTN|nr:hypothetical protein [Planotetraspora silvatica]GII48577.1 hypothetical protein Psi02_50010 [Planotetraspora silvatica]